MLIPLNPILVDGKKKKTKRHRNHSIVTAVYPCIIIHHNNHNHIHNNDHNHIQHNHSRMIHECLFYGTSYAKLKGKKNEKREREKFERTTATIEEKKHKKKQRTPPLYTP
mmetsp:Transcript_31245/g.71931  ORF Transcript_31245/g.71931 Transcript_31245/m.71931 type:complete len:110 (+) Transcript_31245:112-441(+)